MDSKALSGGGYLLQLIIVYGRDLLSYVSVI